MTYDLKQTGHCYLEFSIFLEGGGDMTENGALYRVSQ